MNFKSEETYESTSIPGVSYTLRLIGPPKRAELQLAERKTKDRISEIREEWMKLKKESDTLIRELGLKEDGEPIIVKEPEKATPEIKKLVEQTTALATEFNLLQMVHIKPMWVRAGLKNIKGLTVNDAPITADTLCEFGPDILFDEIFNKIDETAILDPEKLKNS